MKVKTFLIILSVFLILLIGISVIQYVLYRKNVENLKQVYYLKGKNENMLEETGKVIQVLHQDLINLNIMLKHYRDFLNDIKETNRNVKNILEDINIGINSLDDTYTKLYELWSGSN